jgi:hypothetical protein
MFENKGLANLTRWPPVCYSKGRIDEATALSLPSAETGWRLS